MKNLIAGWFHRLIEADASKTDFNVVDPTAVGNDIRRISLSVDPGTPESPMAILSVFWDGSEEKVFEKKFSNAQEAQALAQSIAHDLTEAQKLTQEKKLPEASALLKSLLQTYSTQTDDIVQSNDPVITETNASMKTAACHAQDITWSKDGYQCLNCGGHAMHSWEIKHDQKKNASMTKEAEVVMKNVFQTLKFSTPEEAISYQEKMKALSPDTKPGETPPAGGAMPGMTDDKTAPGSISYDDLAKQDKDKAKEDKGLSVDIKKEVKDQIKSELDRKIATLFTDKDEALVKALLDIGRSWEEVRHFMSKSPDGPKYEEDSVSAYLEKMKEKMTGETEPEFEAPKPDPFHKEEPKGPKQAPKETVSPETHEKLLDEVAPAPEEAPALTEEEIQKKDSLNEIQRSDGEIRRVAGPMDDAPQEGDPAAPPAPAAPQMQTPAPPDLPPAGTDTDPHLKAGDHVYAQKELPTGSVGGFEGVLLSIDKTRDGQVAMIENDETHEVEQVAFQLVTRASKKAAVTKFAELVNGPKRFLLDLIASEDKEANFQGWANKDTYDINMTINNDKNNFDAAKTIIDASDNVESAKQGFFNKFATDNTINVAWQEVAQRWWDHHRNPGASPAHVAPPLPPVENTNVPLAAPADVQAELKQIQAELKAIADDMENADDNWWTSSDGRIELQITPEQAASASHQGQCDEDVKGLMGELQDQLKNIDPQVLKEDLAEYGAWDDAELSDHQENLMRLVWIAAGDVAERAFMNKNKHASLKVAAPVPQMVKQEPKIAPTVFKDVKVAPPNTDRDLAQPISTEMDALVKSLDEDLAKVNQVDELIKKAKADLDETLKKIKDQYQYTQTTAAAQEKIEKLGQLIKATKTELVSRGDMMLRYWEEHKEKIQGLSDKQLIALYESIVPPRITEIISIAQQEAIEMNRAETVERNVRRFPGNTGKASARPLSRMDKTAGPLDVLDSLIAEFSEILQLLSGPTAA